MIAAVGSSAVWAGDATPPKQLMWKAVRRDGHVVVRPKANRPAQPARQAVATSPKQPIASSSKKPVAKAPKESVNTSKKPKQHVAALLAQKVQWQSTRPPDYRSASRIIASQVDQSQDTDNSFDDLFDTSDDDATSSSDQPAPDADIPSNDSQDIFDNSQDLFDNSQDFSMPDFEPSLAEPGRIDDLQIEDITTPDAESFVLGSPVQDDAFGSGTDPVGRSAISSVEEDCQAELAKMKDNGIDSVGLDISGSDQSGQNLPFPYQCAPTDELFADRSWAGTTYMWKASALCHKPLYFEDGRLERYGHSLGPYVQPIASGAHFFATLPILPYKMGLRTPNECVYALGHYRPGNCAPYLLNPVPISTRAVAFQTGAVLGIVALP